MGGSGSTRWGGHRIQRCIGERTIAIRVKSLAPLLVCPDGTQAMAKKATLGTLRFAIVTIPRRDAISADNRLRGDKRIAVSLYDEPLGSVLARGKATQFGGVRWWLLCYTCRKCRDQLFMVDERFWRCRVCLGLKYLSQRLDPVDRLQYRGAKIMKRVGGDGTWLPGQRAWPKPKGMHWSTFERHQRELQSVDALRDSAFVSRNAYFFSRLLNSRGQLKSFFGDAEPSSMSGESDR